MNFYVCGFFLNLLFKKHLFFLLDHLNIKNIFMCVISSWIFLWFLIMFFPESFLTKKTFQHVLTFILVLTMARLQILWFGDLFFEAIFLTRPFEFLEYLYVFIEFLCFFLNVFFPGNYVVCILNYKSFAYWIFSLIFVRLFWYGFYSLKRLILSHDIKRMLCSKLLLCYRAYRTDIRRSKYIW